MIYLTYAEPPSGVYSSQVIDVIKFLNLQGAKIKLVAFVSIREFKKSKAKIRSEMHDAVVLPMLPKATYWQVNVLTLFFYCLFNRDKSIIARNVIATNMALRLRKSGVINKVCFDGRGAMAAEWKEYEMNLPDQWKRTIDAMENKAVTESDFRIAVTAELVHFWQRTYQYKLTDHIVVPCTVNSAFVVKNNLQNTITSKRTELGLDLNDIVFAYSGSTSGWQSFKTLELFLSPLLTAHKHFKIIFLAQQEDSIDSLKKKFPQQVLQQWVAHKEVTKILTACDFGILIREQTITNQVASPTKFAEYLASGLPVIISQNLGDYSAFVKTHQCGINLNGKSPSLNKPSAEEKERMKELVLRYFTKEANREKYEQLLQVMN